jgi:hypothetical protein
VEAIKKVAAIKSRRQAAHIMQRLRKGREVEQKRDIREVQRDMSLIKSPAAGKDPFTRKSFFRIAVAFKSSLKCLLEKAEENLTICMMCVSFYARKQSVLFRIEIKFTLSLH